VNRFLHNPAPSGRPARKRGFTLVELLVVISIIAILATILIPVMGRAIERGEISRARAEMGGLAAAIETYYREYGLWPVQASNGRPDITFGSKNGSFLRKQSEVMNILRATASQTNNTKKMVFMEVPESSMTGRDKDGNTYNVSEGYYLDPWGNPYMICMDTDFDGEVGLCCMSAIVMSYLNAISSDNNAVIPGIGVGIVSYGPRPAESNSVLISWGSR
jgi:prepilin-type N-terminal cleavage/methylation domain-containing protein